MLNEIKKSYISFFSGMKNDLKIWEIFHYLLFFFVIPSLLIVIFYFPENIKNIFFVLDTSNFKFTALILNHYTHSQSEHLFTNLVLYIISVFLIFLFENSKKRLFYSSIIFLFIVPIITSLITIYFFNITKLSLNMQGFSAIASAFFAYALYCLIGYVFIDLVYYTPDYKNMDKKRKILYFVLVLLLSVTLGLIMQINLNFSLFQTVENSIVNGISHYGGFIIGFGVPVLIEIIYGVKFNIIHLTVILSIIMGSIIYISYLNNIVQILLI
ncbi:MAG: hypothetical protein JXR90_12970 [Spirochaetes bacterium]|nr:hypothetical protein [Spirochaetota bacterium]